MASIHVTPSGVYSISFRYAGRQFMKSLKTRSRDEADRLRGRIEGTLLDIERGRLVLPDGADLWSFVLSDGRRTQAARIETVCTLGDLFTKYFDGLRVKEENTLNTERIHRRHVERLLGAARPLASLTTADIQGYVTARAGELYRGKPIGTKTIQKEIATLRMLLNRAEKLVGVKPAFGLFKHIDYPKAVEKPAFQTWAEVERRVAAGATGGEAKALWDAVFLDAEQVGELLEFVRCRKRAVPFFYPLLAAAAHTGARVSELARIRVWDVDFESGTVRLREKKKSQRSETIRQVEMSPLVRRVLTEWLANGHAGGVVLFCREADVRLTTHVLKNVFRRAVARSKWRVLRGYHVLRHSFASNLARRGIDQRVIDDLLGHTTEVMRKRYRHLFPDQRRDAVMAVFGDDVAVGPKVGSGGETNAGPT
jgi:site-specific recombinase XerD